MIFMEEDTAHLDMDNERHINSGPEAIQDTSLSVTIARALA
jgi:hypothetical protein